MSSSPLSLSSLSPNLNHGKIWGPKCGCEFFLLFDDTLPGDERKDEFFALNKVCKFHEPLTRQRQALDPQTHNQAISERLDHLENLVKQHHQKLKADHLAALKAEHGINDDDSNNSSSNAHLASLPKRVQQVVQNKIDKEYNEIVRLLDQRESEVIDRHALALSKSYSLVNIYDQVLKDNINSSSSNNNG